MNKEEHARNETVIKLRGLADDVLAERVKGVFLVAIGSEASENIVYVQSGEDSFPTITGLLGMNELARANLTLQVNAQELQHRGQYHEDN